MPEHRYAVRTVAALLVAGLWGCGESRAGGPVGSLPTRARVAPLFEHGPGDGRAGGWAVGPPVLLPEEDALRILRDELEGRGLGPFDSEVEIEGVALDRNPLPPPLSAEAFQVVEGEVRRLGPASRPNVEEAQEVIPFRADLVNSERGIVVEYVSLPDLVLLRKCFPESTGLEWLDFKDVARSVGERVREQAPPMYFAVFYDPLPSRDSWVHVKLPPEESGQPGGFALRPSAFSAEPSLELQSRDLLRAQVRDFIAWLEDRGAI